MASAFDHVVERSVDIGIIARPMHSRPIHLVLLWVSTGRHAVQTARARGINQKEVPRTCARGVQGDPSVFRLFESGDSYANLEVMQ